VTGRPDPEAPRVFDAVMHRELASGEFKRQQSHFREWVGVDPRTGGDTPFAVEAGRYHLYVALACPWSHRAVILRELAGLQEAIPVSYAVS
jgi:glutathionyl-hydroquinone reductase